MREVSVKRSSLILATTLCFVIALCMAFVLFNTTTEKALADTYYYDDATVYDISEVSYGKTQVAITTNYSVSFGKAAATQNIAFKYVLKMPTQNSWNVKQCFFGPSVQDANTNGSVKYALFYRQGGSNTVKLLIDGATWASISCNSYFALGQTYVVEFGIKNVYSDEGKETFVGRQIYLDSNGNNVFTYFESSVAAISTGSFIGAGTVDGTVSNDGYIGTAYYLDNADVYDMSELSLGKTSATFGGDSTTYYQRPMGALPGKLNAGANYTIQPENVAVKFNMAPPASLGWNFAQGFLGNRGYRNTENNEYIVFYKYAGNPTVTIMKTVGSVNSDSLVSYTLSSGTQYAIELGTRNVYSDNGKESFVGRWVYLKINGAVVVGLLDKAAYNADRIGGYISVPLANGTADTGTVSSTYTQYFDDVTVQDMNDLSGNYAYKAGGANYANSLGEMSSSENTAVKFIASKGTGLAWNYKLGFLKTNSSCNDNYYGYNVFFNMFGSSTLGLHNVTANKYVKLFSYDLANNAEVEIGTRNVYSDSEKTVQVGRQTYIKVNGTYVLYYFDKSVSGGVGDYVIAPVIDGAYSTTGYVKTTYTYYLLTPSTSGNGTVTVSGSADGYAVVGKSFTITASAGDYSELTAFAVNGASVMADITDNGNGSYSYTIGSVVADMSVSVTFGWTTYTVTFKAGGATVDTKNYTMESGSPAVAEPSVPDKIGYSGAWESYSLLSGGNKTVNAVYSAKYDELYGMQMTLGTNLGFIFYARMSEETSPLLSLKIAYEETYLIDTVVEGVLQDDDLELNGVAQGEGVYMFTYRGIAPHLMNSPVTAKLLASDGETEIDSLKNKTVTIKNYLLKLFTSTDNDALKELIANALEYGEQSITYAKAEFDDLSKLSLSGLYVMDEVDMSDTIEDAKEVYAAGDEISFSGRKTVDGAKFVSANIRFDTTNVLMVYFTAESTEGLTVQVGGENAAYTATGTANKYLISVELTASHIKDVFTFSISDGVNTETLTFGVSAYVNMSEGTTIEDLAKALYNYGKSAYEYTK